MRLVVWCVNKGKYSPRLGLLQNRSHPYCILTLSCNLTMKPQRQKNRTSKSLSRRKKSTSNTDKIHHTQASGSAWVSHSSSLQRITGKARQEEEEESSQSSDSQKVDSDVDSNEDDSEDEDSNADDEIIEISGDSSNDEDVSGLPSGSGLVIRIPSKRTADKPRIDKGKQYLHICIYLYVTDLMYRRQDSTSGKPSCCRREPRTCRYCSRYHLQSLNSLFGSAPKIYPLSWTSGTFCPSVKWSGMGRCFRKTKNQDIWWFISSSGHCGWRSFWDSFFNS